MSASDELQAYYQQQSPARLRVEAEQRGVPLQQVRNERDAADRAERVAQQQRVQQLIREKRTGWLPGQGSWEKPATLNGNDEDAQAARAAEQAAAAARKAEQVRLATRPRRWRDYVDEHPRGQTLDGTGYDRDRDTVPAWFA
ncbi:MAG TPA: hypothetical protein VKC57_13290 [Ktedonobacterales bacterium]|nr:hypothetical protein [Ktedonobacterales bacterium]